MQATAIAANKKLYGLDHLRAFAICYVLIFHYRLFGHPDWAASLGTFGWTGVDLFFVLSGYLISSHLFAEISKTGTISLKTYFIKRSFRILPAYFFIVAVYFLVPAYHEREALSPLWRFLTFTKNYGLDVRVFGTFSHSWSLCVEEQFYLVLPLVLLPLAYFKAGKKGLLILAGVFLFGFVIRWYGWQIIVPYLGTDAFWPLHHLYIYYPTYNRLDPLLVGIAVSALYHYRPGFAGKIAKAANWLIPVGILILVAAYYVNKDEASFTAVVFGYPVVAIGYGIIVMAAVHPASILFKHRSAITEKIAALSYSLYLSHKGLMPLTQRLIAPYGISENSNLAMLICFIVIAIGAILLHVAIEKPFLKMRDRILKPKPQSITVQSTVS
ncbi:acyltransferase family protein [Mucilaginibacter psychrotolerans]|uniref:Acyltransferase n=1 Tax=Mucilaginibacter psychrotolerans TaxID=1524096 RepID=A0A4Y8SD52_9SPHI|nr:acyltransferase [Mucilaginibacter psychrotolerans]TFF36527.1 acyltransferase [Mucilaginibacter psychrotolerans]